MPIRNVVISEYGVEKNFLIAFVKSIMSETAFTSNHTLLCKIGANATESNAVTVTTAAEVETQMGTVFSSTSNKPCIWFIIDTYAKILVERSRALTDSSDTYYFSIYANGVITTLSSSSLKFISEGTAYTANETRIFKYQAVSNNNVLYIVFGSAADRLPLTASNASLFVYKETSENPQIICGGKVGSTLRNNDGQALTVKSRLSYVNNASNPTAIETIQNKVAVDVAENKVITMDNIWDSSYSSALLYEVNVTANNQTISAVYLNNYTVMPI